MALFDKAFHESHTLRPLQILEKKKAGAKAIGTFCIFVPDEIALAAEVIPIPLCGGSSWPVEYANRMLPREICPLIRSTFGMAMSNTCPYKNLLDFEVGETTCDAKKKAWDLFKFKVLEVPQKKNQMDLDLWLKEVILFKEMVEELSGVRVTKEKLLQSIRLCNRKRSVLKEINALRKSEKPPISGLDALLVSQLSLNMDIEDFIKAGEMLLSELKDRESKGISAYLKKGLRILLAGTPSPLGNAKVHYVIESSGLQIVADESCTGTRYFRDLVDETDAELPLLLERIARRYFEIDCSCFSPNKERMDRITALAKEFAVDGIIQNILSFCHGYNVEAKTVETRLKKEGFQSLKIVTDYSGEDIEQLRVRIESFGQMIGG